MLVVTLNNGSICHVFVSTRGSVQKQIQLLQLTELHNKPVLLGQANGPDVELIVTGNPLYATYETPSGYAAVYDDGLGLYCYADLETDSYKSTGVPIASPPPLELLPHLRESGDVRAQKSQRQAQRRSGQAHLDPNAHEEP